MTEVDLTEFFRLSKPAKPPCKVGFALSQLKDKADRAAAEAALAMEAGIITGGAIKQWFANRGLEVSVPSVTSHRRGDCTCGDPK